MLKPGKRYIGKAFDDRAGLSVMVDLIKIFANKKNNKCQIVFAATVQEEIGMRGAKTVFNNLRPDIVLNIECGIAKDYPVLFTDRHDIV